MIVALLGTPYLNNYRGIYRKFPCPPKDKKTLLLWEECLDLTQGFPVEYSVEYFTKLYELADLLSRQKILADLVLVDRNIEINNIDTKWLGYDITNDTTFYSVLGEKSFFQQYIYDKWGVNNSKLLYSASNANSVASYMNQHIDAYEQEGKYRVISIECVKMGGKTAQNTRTGDSSMS